MIDCLQEHTFFETVKILDVPPALLDFKFSMLRSKDYRIRTMDVRKTVLLKKILEPTTCRNVMNDQREQ